jgi:hypothetical protein
MLGIYCHSGYIAFVIVIVIVVVVAAAADVTDTQNGMASL